ncbi:MAG: hypothetical protein FWF02_01450 [Micrococcales bacterium]|nr:hypothetical protein [Micrococcales bacterium]MCL2666360.1 hypothetical protein [Micrococcales bacterium]
MTLATRAVITAVLAAAVAAVAFLGGSLPLAACAAVLAVAVALGWPTLANLPERAGSALVVALTGIGGVAAVQLVGERADLRSLAVVFAASMLLTFVNELLRRDGRPRLVESIAGTVTGSMLAVTAAGWVACGRLVDGIALVAAAAVALTAAAAFSAIRFPVWLTSLVTTGAGGAGGGAVGFMLDEVGTKTGTLAGVAVGLLVASLHALFHPIAALDRKLAAVSAAVIPVATAGMLIYVASRVLQATG